MNTARQRFPIAIGLFVAVAFTGCATYTDDTAAAREAERTGDLGVAVEERYELLVDNEQSDRDRLLYLMELSKTLRDFGIARFDQGVQTVNPEFSGVGQGESAPPLSLAPTANYRDILEASNQILDRVDKGIEYWEMQPAVSLSEQSGSVVWNPTRLSYRGYNYDRIMAYTYLALNYMMLGEKENAGAMLRRANRAQRISLERYAEELEQAREESQKYANRGNQSYDTERAQNDPRFQQGYQTHYGMLDRYQAYGDLTNPFTVWLQGIFFTYTSGDMDELQSGLKFLERAYGMSEAKEQIRPDMEAVRAVLGGRQPEFDLDAPGVVFVVFETGSAPERKEIKIDIPLFLVTDSVSHVGVAFPKLEFDGNYSKRLRVTSGSTREKAELVADMDRVVAEEFKYNLPAVITRTLISAGIKAAMEYAASQATSGNEYVDLFRKVAFTAYGAVSNRADLRSWGSLPKQFHLARVPTPADGRLTLETDTRSVTMEILDPTGAVVVYVRSGSAQSPLFAAQFSLTADQPLTTTAFYDWNTQ